MNTDPGKTEFSLEEIDDLRERLRAYKAEHGESWQTLSKKTGIPPSTVAAFTSASYQGDNAKLAAKVHRFFVSDQATRALAEDAPIVPGFQPTKTARDIHAALNYARLGELVVVIGDPGTGKTAALKQYEVEHPNVWRITASPKIKSANEVLTELLRAMGAQRVFSGHAMSRHIRLALTGRPGVIAVDEAQHLSEDALEELRAIHDESRVGLALIGNKTVLTRIEGGARLASFAQLYSRVSWRTFAQTRPEDVEALLDAWAVENAAERKFLKAIALKKGGGALRSLTQVLKAATVSLQGDETETRCLEHLEQAWAQLSARPWAA